MLLMHGPAAHYWNDFESKVVFSRYGFPRFLKLAKHAEILQHDHHDLDLDLDSLLLRSGRSNRKHLHQLQ